MVEFLTNPEIDEITREIVKDYIEVCKAPKNYVDVVGLAKDYLKLNVVYEKISENENAIGFFAKEDAKLRVMRNQKETLVTFPKNTIVLDVSLTEIEQNNRCRFTLAHEIGHYLETRWCSISKACNYMRRDMTKGVTIEKYFEMLNVKEMQANRIAAALLMPDFMLKNALNCVNQGKNILVYGEQVFLTEEKEKMKKIMHMLGVGLDTLRIRMRQLRMLDHQPMEILLNTMKGGERQ